MTTKNNPPDEVWLDIWESVDHKTHMDVETEPGDDFVGPYISPRRALELQRDAWEEGFFKKDELGNDAWDGPINPYAAKLAEMDKEESQNACPDD